MEKGKLLVIHGGAPTAVMNASLVGVLKAAARQEAITGVLGANGGTGGVLSGKFIDLTTFPKDNLSRLAMTPGSAIGTSRTPLYAPEYERMREVLLANDIRYVLMNGGNGTMDTCGKLAAACAADGILVGGIPKTIDNDIAETDHAPGYGSAARYLAATVSEIAQDLHGLPIHVCIVEAMGRNAGWLAAASALAMEGGYGPDLIYLPERDFDEDAFLADVQEVYRKKGCALVVASEGLHKAGGEPIVEPIFRTDRAVYYGDVSAHLANLVIRRLGIKARSEKPGICGRASFAHQSPVDRMEAEAAGMAAVQMVAGGRSGAMISFNRLQGDNYRIDLNEVPIEKVMMVERKMPRDMISQEGNGVTEKFTKWCMPLLGGPLPSFFHFPER